MVWLLTIVFMLQSGCAAWTPKVTATTHQPVSSRLAIISMDRGAEVEFEGFSRGKGEGAAHAAGSVFVLCASSFGSGDCSGELCGALVILMLGMCGVASLAGGVAGAVDTPAAGTVAAAEADMSAVTQARTIQESLRRQIMVPALEYGVDLVSVADERAYAASSAQDYSMLAADGVDTVMEVALTKVGTRGWGGNSPIQLYMQAHIRLIRTADNLEIFSDDYEYLGERLMLAEWSANEGQRLLHALEQGYKVLGSHIHDSIFLLYPFPDRNPHTVGLFAAAFGLAPLEPELRGTLTGDPLIGHHFEWKTAVGLRPTFRWQGFPRDTDITVSPEEMRRIRNVRYDLVVAREENMAPGEIVYRYEDLTDTVHTIRKALQTGTRYFWTVRARFELDGRERVTEWATTNYLRFGRLASPSSWSYRFKTP